MDVIEEELFDGNTNVAEGRTFADVLADRDAKRAAWKEVLEFKWKTGKVRSLKINAGPEGCSGKHCAQVEGHCKEVACSKWLEEELSIANSRNEAAVADIESQLQSIDELLWDISIHCKTDDLNYPTMEESRLALESALRNVTEASLCECVACELSFKQKEAKVLKQKVSAVEARLKILREYRRANDKEALERTNSSYMKGGKYFTPVGGAKGKGVKALRPTLQMQSSYDVVNLTTNSMEERALVGPTQKSNKKKR